MHGLVCFPLVALLGFDFKTVAVCAAISNCWQILEHTSAPLRFPPLVRAWLMTPDAHRHHHARDAAGAVNLGPVFTVWDRLAGTWIAPDAPAPRAYGLAGRGHNPVAIELAGWRALLSVRNRLELDAGAVERDRHALPG